MTQWKNSNGFQRFVTSSEDTKIRLLSFEENDINESIIPSELDTLAILNGHESSVKELLITQVPGQDGKYHLVCIRCDLPQQIDREFSYQEEERNN